MKKYNISIGNDERGVFADERETAAQAAAGAHLEAKVPHVSGRSLRSYHGSDTLGATQDQKPQRASASCVQSLSTHVLQRSSSINARERKHIKGYCTTCNRPGHKTYNCHLRPKCRNCDLFFRGDGELCRCTEAELASYDQDRKACTRVSTDTPLIRPSLDVSAEGVLVPPPKTPLAAETSIKASVTPPSGNVRSTTHPFAFAVTLLSLLWWLSASSVAWAWGGPRAVDFNGPASGAPETGDESKAPPPLLRAHYDKQQAKLVKRSLLQSSSPWCCWRRAIPEKTTLVYDRAIYAVAANVAMLPRTGEGSSVAWALARTTSMKMHQNITGLTDKQLMESITSAATLGFTEGIMHETYAIQHKSNVLNIIGTKHRNALAGKFDPELEFDKYMEINRSFWRRWFVIVALLVAWLAYTISPAYSSLIVTVVAGHVAEFLHRVVDAPFSFIGVTPINWVDRVYNELHQSVGAFSTPIVHDTLTLNRVRSDWFAAEQLQAILIANATNYDMKRKAEAQLKRMRRDREIATLPEYLQRRVRRLMENAALPVKLNANGSVDVLELGNTTIAKTRSAAHIALADISSLPIVPHSDAPGEANALTKRVFGNKIEANDTALQSHAKFLYDLLCAELPLPACPICDLFPDAGGHRQCYAEWNSLERVTRNVQAKHDLALADLPRGLRRTHHQRCAFAKVELTTGKALAGHYDPLDERIIQDVDPRVHVSLGPYMYAFSKYVAKRWGTGNWLCYASGVTASEAAQFVEPGLTYYVGDLSRFDRSIHPKTLTALNHWRENQTHLSTDARECLTKQCDTFGVTLKGRHRYAVAGQRKSGDDNTSIDNTILNITAHVWAVSQVLSMDVAEIKQHFKFMALGDDIIITGPASLRQVDFIKVLNGIGWAPKPRFESHVWDVDFCSRLRWPSTNGPKFGVKPGRALSRFPFSAENPSPVGIGAKAYGLYIDNSHVPFIRKYLERCMELDPVRATIKLQEWQFRSSTGEPLALPTDETWAMFESRYHLSERDEAEYALRLTSWHGGPAYYNDPIVAIIFAAEQIGGFVNEPDVAVPIVNVQLDPEEAGGHIVLAGERPPALSWYHMMHQTVARFIAGFPFRVH
jgi:hypothetical protein